MNAETPTAPVPTTLDLTGLLPDPAERPPLIGRYAHLGWEFPMEDFEEARRAMSKNFPRDLPETGSPMNGIV